MAAPSGTPDARRTIDDLLGEARSHLRRLDPLAAQRAITTGAVLIDIRSEGQRAAGGAVPDAICLSRNVLEWRCDPSCPAHDPRVRLDRRVIVMCDQGYQSSLAAATLQKLGLDATDLIGGFQAWLAAGLPVIEPCTEELVRAMDCSCGRHLEGADDEELFRRAREHIARDHPEMKPSDEEVRRCVAAEAYDISVAARR